jgi:DNA-binding NtrC family response regulator
MKSVVVIATEDPELVHLLSKILFKRDCSVTITKSRILVVLNILTQEIAYAVLDFDLPHSTNLELLSIIRKIKPKLPVIIFSQETSEDILTKIAEHGIFYYGMKSGSITEIEQVIDAAEQFAQEYHKDCLPITKV